MDVRKALEDTEANLRSIQAQLERASADHTWSGSAASPTSALLSSSSSPGVPVLQQLKRLVERTQQQLHSQVKALHAVPSTIDANVGLFEDASHSSSASSYPLSFALPRSPPPVPAQHRPAIASVLEARHAQYLATPERDASRAYLMARFGLSDGSDGGAQRGRRPIEVYGRVGGGGKRRTPKADRQSRERASALGTLHPSASFGPRNTAAVQSEGGGLRVGGPVPREAQHLGLFELVNRGYLPAKLHDLGTVKNVPFASIAQGRASGPAAASSDLAARESLGGIRWIDEPTDAPRTARAAEEKEKARETMDEHAEDAASLFLASSPGAASHRSRHSRHVSRASRHSTASTMVAEEHKEALSFASKSSSTTPHQRVSSLSSASSRGSLHDSFSSPSHRSSSSLPLRSYEAVLDDFSNHPIFVHHGRVLSDTPEYSSFQRAHSATWPQLSALLALLVRFAHTVPGGGVLTFYGSALVALVQRGVLEPSRDELMECLAPADLTVVREREHEAHKRAEEERRRAAATLIAATARMHLQRKRFAVLRHRHRAARIIQRKFRRWRALLLTRRFVNGQWQEKVARWKLVQQQWVASYTAFAQRHRVHVHIPSLSLSAHQRHGLFPHVSLHENQHLPRLCELSNPLISIIYLTATPLPHDVYAYYLKLLEVGGVKGLDQRLHVLSPELSSFFSDLAHPFPLASLALYSARLLSTMRAVLRGRPAIIIPADAGFSDWMLAVELGLPLYCVDVEKKHRMDGVGGTQRLISAWNDRVRADRERAAEQARVDAAHAAQDKHSRRPSNRFQAEAAAAAAEKAADVAAEELYAPVSACDVFDEDELYARLTELVVAHRAVDVWVMRVDDDRDGRGVAWLQVSQVVGLRALLDAAHVGEEERAEGVEALLADQLHVRVVLLHPSFHLSVAAYFALFYRLGGVIQPYPALPSFSSPLTSPTVSMLIEPNGQLTMLSSHDRSLVRPFSALLSAFPSAHPSPALHALAAALGKACWREGVIGHVSVDFLTLPSSLVHAPPALSLVPSSLPAHVLVPVAVHLHCTAAASEFALFHFLMQGRYLWRSRPLAVYRVLKPGVREARKEEQKALKLENKKKFHRASTSSNIDHLAHARPPTSQPTPAAPAAPVAVLPAFAARALSRALSTSLGEAEEERFYAALPLLRLQPLSKVPLSSFFALCRLHQASFDVGERRGLCFMLYGSMTTGRLGLLGVDASREDGVRRVQGVLRLMEAEWGKGLDGAGDSEAESGGQSAALRDVLKTVSCVGHAMHARAGSSSRFPAISRQSSRLSQPDTLDVPEEKQRALSSS